MMFDYLIVGSGLFGAVFAHEAKKTGKLKRGGAADYWLERWKFFPAIESVSAILYRA
ncbi:hypothetical protein [Selenomonas sp. AE3005]|uniref:hypothetical protein n=1 Tax=Selenomonas sp. AE3005 TaxID=1485543 RepID=UPI000A551D16|nr:hypothetical protein [Selenomonas sp. AE3005]